MLQTLYVKNLALINEVEIDLRDGLNILTGETGAGKSIIIDSISFALGGKIDRNMLRAHDEAGYVELIFSDLSEPVCKQLRMLEIEPEEQTVILSRRISGGRSVAKINGESVPASKLREAAACLIDIHGQHEHQSLLHASKHLEYLDDYAGAELIEKKHKLAEAYHRYTACQKRLNEQCSDREALAREQSFLEYEVSEIEGARLLTGEDEELETRYRRMTNSKRIMEALQTVDQAVGEDGASALIGRAARELVSVSSFDTALDSMSAQITQIEELLSDFGRDLAAYMDEAQFDGEQFAQVEERLDVINHLKSKYGDTIEQIMAACAKKQERIEQISDIDVYEQRLRRELDEARDQLEGLCSQVSKLRQKAGRSLREKMLQALRDLNFLDVAFDLKFTRMDHYSANGYDTMEFMISTNPGEPLRELKNIASGGELSRVMLALKSVLAENDGIKTLIFDEIDTGISGRTAQMVSQKLHKIAGNHQVICITHLPQIAAMADAHYFIEKKVVDGTTVTQLTLLDEERSIAELGRMLGGVEVTDTVLKSAREMKKLAMQAK